MININSLWDDVKNRLSAKIQAISFEVWIQKLEPVCFVQNQLVLLANSKSAKQTIEQRFSDTILETVKEFHPIVENVIIITENQKDGYLKQQDYILEEEFVVNEPQKPQPQGFSFSKKYTFGNFVVGKSNEFACAAAQAVAAKPGSKNNPLFIYGGVGLGKTHIMHAIGNYIREHSPQLKILYTTAEKFTNELIESIKPTADRNAPNEFREKYRNVDVLMIDDIQFLARTNAAQEAIFHTFNDLYQNDKHVIISSDRPPKEIYPLEERLRTRFQWGLLADIQPPDLETRIAILETKATQENFYLPHDVATYIAEMVTTNIREMESLLNKAIFYSSLSGKPLTVEMAREALGHIGRLREEALNENDIINKTCQYFGISRADIVGKKRTKELVEARMIAIYLIRELLKLPLQSIGSLFGGRDHTTIINARDKISDQIKNNNRVKIQVNDIKDMLNHL